MCRNLLPLHVHVVVVVQMDVVLHAKVHVLGVAKVDVIQPAKVHVLESVLERVRKDVIPHALDFVPMDAKMGVMTHAKVHVLERVHHRVEQVVHAALAHVPGVMAVVAAHVLVAPSYVVCHVVQVAPCPVAPGARQDAIQVAMDALDVKIHVFHVVMFVRHLAMHNVKIIA